MNVVLPVLRRWAPVVALSVLLGGCSLSSFISSGPVPDLYSLTSARPDASALAATSAQVVVMPFSTAGALDTDRIALQPSPLELKYYADARWSDTMPLLVQSQIISSLQNMNRFGGVSNLVTALRADYAISGNIRSFAVDRSQGGAGVVKLEILVSISRQDDLRTVATRDFTSSVMVGAAGKMIDVVTAYNKALTPMLNDISLWTLGEITKDQAGRPLDRTSSR